jgi:hypothetical protein
MKTLKTNAEGYGYKYTDLAEVHKYLETINTSYYQYIEAIDGNDYIVTVPIVDGKELTPKRGCRVVQASLSGKSNPAQEQGAALTYARRYSLLMAFGLATEDDDAETLTKKPEAYVYQNVNSVSPRIPTAPHNGQDNGEVMLATGAQIYTIKNLGGTVTEGLTKMEASKIISDLKS